jgi:hypothetical protein
MLPASFGPRHATLTVKLHRRYYTNADAITRTANQTTICTCSKPRQTILRFLNNNEKTAVGIFISIKQAIVSSSNNV